MHVSGKVLRKYTYNLLNGQLQELEVLPNEEELEDAEHNDYEPEAEADAEADAEAEAEAEAENNEDDEGSYGFEYDDEEGEKVLMKGTFSPNVHINSTEDQSQ